MLAHATDLSIDDIGRLIRARSGDIADCGVTAVFVYGSRARGDNRPDSDLDVFVEYDEHSRFSMIKLARIQLLIEQATGLPVHATTANSIPTDRMRAIARDAARVL